MPEAKPLSKEQILAAMAKTMSNKAAARYLHVSYIHYKKWAKNYDATEEGYPNLFEQHKNQAGKGIPKFLNGSVKQPAVLDIIEGRVDSSHFSAAKIRERMIGEGYLEDCCSKNQTLYNLFFPKLLFSLQLQYLQAFLFGFYIFYKI